MKRSYKTVLKIFFGFEILLHVVLGVGYVVTGMMLRVDLHDYVMTASQHQMFSWVQIVMYIYFAVQLLLFVIFYNINNRAKVLEKPTAEKPVVEKKPVEEIEE